MGPFSHTWKAIGHVENNLSVEMTLSLGDIVNESRQDSVID